MNNLEKETLAGSIVIYRNSWENVDETVSMFESYANNPMSYPPFEQAGLLDHLSPGESNPRTNSHISLQKAGIANMKMRKIHDQYYNLIKDKTLDYVEQFYIGEQFFIDEPFNILRYQTGQEYKAHYDGGTATGRSISPILYLNDDYEGGEIEFVNFGIKIKPEKGMLVIFPASYAYAHIAHPVKSGTKYAIVTWLHDREMDETIVRALNI